MNGQEGVLLMFDEAKGRWQIKLNSGKVLEVKPENLQEKNSWEDSLSAVACALRFDDAPVGIAQCALEDFVRIATEICVFRMLCQPWRFQTRADLTVDGRNLSAFSEWS